MRRSRLRPMAFAAIVVCAAGCGSDPALAFARLVERAGSWGASMEFALQLAADGMVPRAYVDDLMQTASEELATLSLQIDDAQGVDDDMKRTASAACTGLAATAADAARAHGTPRASSIRELEQQLRAAAQQARAAAR
jgi:hypothetical protein